IPGGSLPLRDFFPQLGIRPAISTPTAFVGLGDFLGVTIAFGIWAVPLGPAGGTRLATETRVHATDSAARRRFRLYWFVVAPFSALIRRRLHRRRELEDRRQGDHVLPRRQLHSVEERADHRARDRGRALHDPAHEPDDRREQLRAARTWIADDPVAAREEQDDHRGDEDREGLLIENRQE